MFVCTDCGNVFEEPRVWKESHGLNYGLYEYFSECPYCGGDYAETHECDICGEWIVDKYIKTDDGRRFCDNCYLNMELGDEDY